MGEQLRASGDNPTMTPEEFQRLAKLVSFMKNFEVCMSEIGEGELGEETFKIFTEKIEKSISEMTYAERIQHRVKLENAIRLFRTMVTAVVILNEADEAEMTEDERKATRTYSQKMTGKVKERMKVNEEKGKARDKAIRLITGSGKSESEASKLFDALLAGAME